MKISPIVLIVLGVMLIIPVTWGIKYYTADIRGRISANETIKSGAALIEKCRVNREDVNYPYLTVTGIDHERVRKVYSEQKAGFKLQHNIP